MGARRLVVEADGGSRGNPGVAGYGALVRDPDTGAVLAEVAEPLGLASNNVAEYSGLVAGLDAVLQIEAAADVEVRLDSKLVVEQMAGRWKIRHEDMRRLALQARDRCALIRAAGGSVSFTWVPREGNQAADALSNVAMDGRRIRRFPAAGAASEGPAAMTSAAPDAGGSARLILVRHGVTDLTVANRVEGRGGSDPPLNERGRRQAESTARAARALVEAGPVRVVASALARAAETGAAIANVLGVPVETDAAWDEQGFGDWDGWAIADLEGAFPRELGLLRDDPGYRRPGGESLGDLERRVLPAFGRLSGQGGSVVVVTSRKPILVVLTHLLKIPPDRFWALATAPGSLTAVDVWPDGRAAVEFTNRTAHLA